jgi:hypothetical protein
MSKRRRARLRADVKVMGTTELAARYGALRCDWEVHIIKAQLHDQMLGYA